VGIGDDCPPTEISGCFYPTPLVIDVGDSVTFAVYAELIPNGPHNVVADDGSFSSGPPGDYQTQWRFTQTFNVPGVVRYHDEVTQASGVVIVQDASQFTIGPGITGAWYDPDQSGHGLLIEVLSDNRFYATWFAFNPAGTEQSWFTGVGSYSGAAATVNVQMPTAGDGFRTSIPPGSFAIPGERSASLSPIATTAPCISARRWRD
jgi:hypothetical protein